MAGESRKPAALAEFQQAAASLLHVWDDTVATDEDSTPIPVFLDLLSGPNYPLSQAFYWAGWKVVQPIDLQIDAEFDITNPSVQTAIAHILPKCHLVSTAMIAAPNHVFARLLCQVVERLRRCGVSSIHEAYRL